MLVIPVGGCGEFGKNATAIASGPDSLLIDCGLQMPDDLSPGIDHYVPDLRGLLDRHPPGALLLTHGHEDHIGAVPHLLRCLDGPLPIHGRPLTLRLLERILDEARTPRRLRDLRPLRPGEEVAVGALRARAIAVPHSIPDACALLVRGPDVEGAERAVLHSGDLKLDDAPGALDVLPDAVGAIDLLIADSTNAGRPGRSGSEAVASAALAGLSEAAPGRLVVALFSSHIARVAHFAESCARAGRRLCLLGRGLREAVAAASEARVLRLPQALLCDEDEAARLPPRRLGVLCTGSQGEPEAALGRLAALLPGGDAPVESRHALAGVGRLRLQAGDTVVLSARTIPGRELPLARLEARLLRAGLVVRSGPEFSVSGHACQDELRELLERVRPRALLPVHGGPRQLLAHAALAEAAGVPALRCRDGDVIAIGAEIALAGRIPVGRLAIEGGGAPGEVTEETLRHRRRLAHAGVVVAAGRPVAVRALGVCDPGPLLDELCAEAARAAQAALGPAGWAAPDGPERVRLAVRRVFFRARGVRPNVVVVPPGDLV